MLKEINTEKTQTEIIKYVKCIWMSKSTWTNKKFPLKRKSQSVYARHLWKVLIPCQTNDAKSTLNLIPIHFWFSAGNFFLLFDDWVSAWNRKRKKANSFPFYRFGYYMRKQCDLMIYDDLPVYIVYIDYQTSCAALNHTLYIFSTTFRLSFMLCRRLFLIIILPYYFFSL